MTSPSSAPIDLASPWAGRALSGALGRFLDENTEPLERRLALESDALGNGLGALGDVLARAVGTNGRGGGRWRPLLALAAAEACGAARGHALDVAVAVELTHTASLVLDDLPCMDDAPLRRGQPATHRLVGSAGAILLSVGLLARAVELLGRQSRCGGVLSEHWGRTVGLAGMSGGQVMDVAASSSLRGAKRRLHREKSAALPAFALSSGARCAGAGEAARAGLEAFGRGLGWAYQIRDDVEDKAEDTRLGRAPGSARMESHAARLMRRAFRRLEEAPGLRDDGVEILVGLAGRVVPECALQWESAQDTREGRL